jgi:hypothetical protein
MQITGVPSRSQFHKEFLLYEIKKEKKIYRQSVFKKLSPDMLGATDMAK